MLKILSYIIIFLLSFFFQPIYAQSANQAELEIRLFALINNARVNPLATAASLGINPDKVLADLPELHDVLVNGLPKLLLNPNLKNAAQSHLNDMLNRNYYGHVSPEGLGSDVRIYKSGYLGEITGESLGILGFINFIAPEDAVNRIFKNMFLDELNPVRSERRNILAPDLKEIGVGFGSGQMDLGDRIYNTYLVVCNFGAKIEYSIVNKSIEYDLSVEGCETALLNLINQTRIKPFDVVASLGIDTEKLLTDLPELYEVFTLGLPPLNISDSLQTAARLHAQDMADNSYYSHDSQNGKAFNNRINESGYSYDLVIGEILGLVNLDNISKTSEAVQELFKKMLLDELDPEAENHFIIFNPDIKEIGIGFQQAILEIDGVTQDVCLTVCDFGKGEAEKQPVIMGIVFTDFNQDGLYNAGEGSKDITIAVYGYDNRKFPILEKDYGEMLTNEAGRFYVDVMPGISRVTAYLPNISKEYIVRTDMENQMIFLQING